MALLQTSPATAATMAAKQVTEIVEEQFQQLAQSGLHGYALIWQNPVATPQQVIAALGTNAVAVFELADLNITTIASAAAIGGVSAPTIPAVPAGWTVTASNVSAGALIVTVPPATVPAGLTATNGSNGAALAWTAVPGALAYTIERSTDSGTSFQALATINASVTGMGQVARTPPAATYTDAAGASGNQYQISVTTPAGTSAFSAAVTL